MVPKQNSSHRTKVGEKKGSCSPQKAELRLLKRIKMFATPNIAMSPLFLDKNAVNLLRQLFYFLTFWAISTLWPARWHHVGPNKPTLIYSLYEYSDPAVCDTKIAAGVLGPLRCPPAMPGHGPQHLGQGGLSRPSYQPSEARKFFFFQTE